LVGKSLSVNGKQFEWDKDYALSFNAIATGKYNYTNTVFAGYGLDDAANKMTDYDGLDVKGKIVIVLDGLPDGYKPATNQMQGGRGFGGPGSANAKALTARNKGAAGVLVVTKDFPKATPTVTKGNMYLQKNTSPSFVSGTISEEVASALLGRTFKMSSTQLKETNKGNYVAELRISAEKNTAELQSSNVIGVLEGTDKKMSMCS